MDRFKPKKIRSYIGAYLREVVPSAIWRQTMPDFEGKLEKRQDKDYIISRVLYYNRISGNFRPETDFMRIGDGICRIDQSRWLKSSFDHDEGVTRPVQRSGIERVLDRGSRQYRYRSWKEMENEVVLFHEVGGNRIVRMVLVHWISSCWCKRIFRWTK